MMSECSPFQLSHCKDLSGLLYLKLNYIEVKYAQNFGHVLASLWKQESPASDYVKISVLII